MRKSDRPNRRRMFANRRIIAFRLRDICNCTPGFDMTDVHLLRVGRHFRVQPTLKVIPGRNEAENEGISPGGP